MEIFIFFSIFEMRGKQVILCVNIIYYILLTAFMTLVKMQNKFISFSCLRKNIATMMREYKKLKRNTASIFLYNKAIFSQVYKNKMPLKVKGRLSAQH